MRGKIVDGELHVEQRQDSALLTVLNAARVLVVHKVHTPAQPKGMLMEYIPL
jgi:hypothetical protein